MGHFFLYFCSFYILQWPQNKIYPLPWPWLLPSVISFNISLSLTFWKLLYAFLFLSYSECSLVLEHLHLLFPLPGALCPEHSAPGHCVTNFFISFCSIYHILREDQPNWSHLPAPCVLPLLSISCTRACVFLLSLSSLWSGRTPKALCTPLSLWKAQASAPHNVVGGIFRFSETKVQAAQRPLCRTEHQTRKEPGCPEALALVADF